MYRYLIAALVLLCLSAGWLTAPKNVLNIDQISLHQLLEQDLTAEISKQKKALFAVGKKNRPYLELTLGYLYYRKTEYPTAENYFQKVIQHSSSPFQDYAHFYLGKIAMDHKDCGKTTAFKESLSQKFSDSIAHKRFSALWEASCRPKPEIVPKTRKARIQKLKLDLYESAVEKFEEKDYSSALFLFHKYLNRVHRDHAHVEDALTRLSIIHKRLRQDRNYLKTIKKLSRYQQADKKFPYNPKWVYETALYYWNHEQTGQTKRYLNKLIRWPYHGYVGKSYYVLARIEAENKSYPKAIDYLTQAMEYVIDPDHQEKIAYLRGWYTYKIKNYHSTVEDFEAFRKTFPESDYFDRVSYWLGRTYSHQKHGQKAEDIFREIANKSPYTYYGLRSLQHLNESKKERQFKNLLAFNYPREVFRVVDKKHFKKAEKLLLLGMGKDGVEELKAAVPPHKLKKTSWEFQYYIAALYHIGGDHISTFTILNKLQETHLEELPKDHARILYPKRYWPIIKKFASQFDVDPYLLLSVMRQESAFDPEAISPADAYGLLQMTPYMAQAMGKRLDIPLKSKDDLFKPEINLLYSAYYLSELIKKYKGNLVLALATYNANDKAVKKWIKRYWVEDIEEFIEEIPYQETRAYVKLVLRNYLNNLYIYEGEIKSFHEIIEPGAKS